MRCTVDSKIVVRDRDVQVLEKQIGHFGVKVLSCMNDDLGDRRPLFTGFIVVFANDSANRRSFYKLRTAPMIVAIFICFLSQSTPGAQRIDFKKDY